MKALSVPSNDAGIINSSFIMKNFSLLILAAVLAVVTPIFSARAEAEVDIDFFYDALSPHGDWIYADDYGYVFQPAVAQDTDWAPYSDGYWSYTDAGWTWISNEDFGWATYHYGRWVRMQDSWVWVPGNEWAPAWVSWRQTDDHVGWAPLPPEARWSANVGFNRWSDDYYDVGPSYYNFVPFNLFARRTSLRPVIVNRSRNLTYINRSVNVTNISYRQNVVNNIFVGGPDPDRFDRGDNRIRRLRLHRDDDRFRRDWIDNRGDRPRDYRNLSRIENDDFYIASPRVRASDSPRLPSRVKERIDRPQIDRGWRGAGDEKALENLRERRRAEFAKAKPGELPDKRPELITGKVPPPAIGRVLNPEERGPRPQRPGPGQVEEEVRRARPDDGRPGERRPGSPRDEPPAPGESRRPGMTERDLRPGENRPSITEREGPPGVRGPEGRRPDGQGPDLRPENTPPTGRRPGARSGDLPERPDRPERPERPLPGARENDRTDRPEGRPGVKPDEAPRPRLAPGVVPNEESRRPGGVPTKPKAPSKNQDRAPGPRSSPEDSPATTPQTRPDMPPRVTPDVPGNRERPEGRRPENAPPRTVPNTPGNRERGPETRRPDMPPRVTPNAPSNRERAPEAGRRTPPQARPSPSAEPRKAPPENARPAPRPEVQRERPAPSKPQAGPRQKKEAERKVNAPEVRAARPQPRSAPQVKKSAPQVKRSAPQARPKQPQVKRAPAKAKPQSRPAAKRGGKKGEERRGR